MRTAKLVLAALVSVIPPSGVTARSREQAPETPVTISATEVQLDAVVRDARGRAVRDLTAADFEILEDGAPQEIASCAFVTRSGSGTTASAAAPSAGGRAAAADPSRLRAVALVFDRLDPAARELARKTASRYVAEFERPDDVVGVFVTDLGLRVVQGYTSDKRAVAAAVESATAGATATFRSQGDAVRELTADQSATVQRAAPKVAAENRGPATSGGDGGDPAAAKLRLMEARSLDAWERLEREQQGDATTKGLFAVVKGLAELPGRKAVLFFSTGVVMAPAAVARFRAVVDAANRAGVSIYTVDAAGLRVDSPRGDLTRDIYSPPSALGSVQPGLRSVERMEDEMRSVPEGNLGLLARETGGEAVRDTNDASRVLPRIDEDLDAHYVLAYAPKDTDLDGRFRRIAVRVRRPGLVVRSREGYFALPSLGGLDVQPFEARALALLASGREATAFPLRAVALHVGSDGGATRVAIVASAPGSSMAVVTDSKAGTYSTDYAFVAVLRDRDGEPVAKASQRVALAGPAAAAAAVSKGDLLFYRETSVSPGRYTLEVAAVDAASGRSAAYRGEVDVPAGGGPLETSSLVVIDRAERAAPGETAAAEPLRYGDLVLYPNLGGPLSKATTKQLAFFVTLVATRASTKPALAIEVLSGGRPVARVETELPAPDADGRVRFANAIPVEGFPPGDYELRVTATAGADRATESARFRLDP